MTAHFRNQPNRPPSEPDAETPEASWQTFFLEAASNRRRQNLERFRGGIQEPTDLKLDFGNNDYMGMSQNPAVIDAMRNAAQVGSTASPALRGYHSVHRELEARIADWCATEDSLVFSSGYATNVGVLSCLASAGDLILSDQLNHASLIDGSRLSKAQVQIFPHNDIEFIAGYLTENRPNFRRVLLVTESIFSMDGDAAPLKSLAELCNRFECGLIVDEAHATGAFGSTGSGLLEDLQLAQSPLLKIGTLSKALGVGGGYAAGSQQAIQHLVNHCRSYIYSTAMPLPIASAALAAISELEAAHQERKRLRERSMHLRSTLRSMGWQIIAGESPIIPLVVGSETKCLEMATRIREKGIYVPAIRPPTVPPGTARLRISLNATHTESDVAELVEALAEFPPRK